MVRCLQNLRPWACRPPTCAAWRDRRDSTKSTGDGKAPAGGVKRGNVIDKQYDLNGNVGGPVWRGKAWFFASYRLNNQYKFITGVDDLAQSKLSNYTIKGTYQLTRSNQLIGYWNRREKLQPLRDFGATTPLSAALYQASRNFPFKAEWSSVINDRMFLDVIVAGWRNYFPLRPTAEYGLFDESQFVPGRQDLTTLQFFDGGANSAYQDQRGKQSSRSRKWSTRSCPERPGRAGASVHFNHPSPGE